MRKLVFQRKTDVVERAVSWYQEAIDCYRMMQTACDALEEEYNPTIYNRLLASFAQAGRLYENTSKVLNPIYLYYNFSDIESKYDIQNSWEYINFTIKELGRIDQLILELYSQGLTDESDQIKALRNKALDGGKFRPKYLPRIRYGGVQEQKVGVCQRLRQAEDSLR
jgi:hypothetical protein